MPQAQPFTGGARQADLNRYPVSLQIAARAVFGGRYPDLRDEFPARTADTPRPCSL